MEKYIKHDIDKLLEYDNHVFTNSMDIANNFKKHFNGFGVSLVDKVNESGNAFKISVYNNNSIFFYTSN